MKVYLKVKIKSLAAEATIIRKEENKAKGSFRYLKNKTGMEDEYRREQAKWFGLYSHRTQDVRKEARASQLAYAYIRGKSFSDVEANTNPFVYHSVMKWELSSLGTRIAKMATKYGDKEVTRDDIIEWIKNTHSVMNKKAA